MSIKTINKKLYVQCLVEKQSSDTRNAFTITNKPSFGQLNKYRNILRANFTWLNRNQFLKIIETAASRKISISEFFENYNKLYSEEVENKIVEYENDLLLEAKQDFPKTQITKFNYSPGAKILNKFGQEDLPIYYDLYDPSQQNADRLGFVMSGEEIWIKLISEWLPLFRQYDNIKFEVQNKKFTISKFLNDTYSKCLFMNCEFEDVIFNNQIITECKFIDCVFKRSSLCNVNIRTSLFNNCKFIESNFESAYLKECQFNNCQFLSVFWDIGPIVECKFEECSFKENSTLSLTCENVTFYKDGGWITISLDGTWACGDFLHYISII